MDESDCLVTDIDIYPNVDADERHGRAPVLEPVIAGACGTYRVEAYGCGVGITLELAVGASMQTVVAGLNPGSIYVAQVTGADGTRFVSPPLRCVVARGAAPALVGFQTLAAGGGRTSSPPTTRRPDRCRHRATRTA